MAATGTKKPPPDRSPISRSGLNGPMRRVHRDRQVAARACIVGLACILVLASVAVACARADPTFAPRLDESAIAEPSDVRTEPTGAPNATDADPNDVDPTEGGVDAAPAPLSGAGPAEGNEPDTGEPGTGLPTLGPVADDRIVVATASGGIFLVDRDGDNRIDLAQGGLGTALHPVWRPDGRRVAWSQADANGFSVMSSNIDGTERRRAQSPFGGYFGSWDPTSSTLGILGPAAPGTGLVFDAGTGAAMPGVVDRDTFYFFSWSPDGRQWIVHSGSGFRIKGIDGSTTPLELDGGRFRTPVWARDGTIFMTLAGPDGNVIVRLDPERLTASEVFTGGDETNFVLDPTGRYLAVQTTDVRGPSDPQPDLGEPGTVSTRRQTQQVETTSAVVIVDLSSDSVVDVIGTETGGLWWSPDGSRLAILAPHGDDTQLVHWTVWSKDASFTTQPFRLTPFYAQAYVPFFDQFAQSVTPWSPDSSRFVYPGIGIDDDRGIYVQEARAGVAPQLIADGILAFWSPT